MFIPKAFQETDVSVAQFELSQNKSLLQRLNTVEADKMAAQINVES